MTKYREILRLKCQLPIFVSFPIIRGSVKVFSQK